MSYIYVIVDCKRFLSFVKKIALKHKVDCFFEYRSSIDRTMTSYKQVDFNLENYNSLINEEYDRFFFISKEVPVDDTWSFYDKGILEYSIEGTGGRQLSNEIELIELRLIGKKPEKAIKSFFNAINYGLKKDEDFSQGIGPSSHRKKIFYLNEVADNGFEIWNNLKNKNVALTIIKQ
ncbi:hypothetical protein [Flavobacterium cerinum]|uniref:Uncharacterized protein n=1 Tax=Flavobacterium cerinum TaxID=2502784 RepID=A0A444GLS5_9FLAO|nr:hypothetical protein [Flavobacterium cerinum]RWW91956.1 hypothetical protein EPI11_17160 [Flavobacterium cerinum]